MKCDCNFGKTDCNFRKYHRKFQKATAIIQNCSYLMVEFCSIMTATLQNLHSHLHYDGKLLKVAVKFQKLYSRMTVDFENCSQAISTVEAWMPSFALIVADFAVPF